jgi:hypothetical protein
MDSFQWVAPAVAALTGLVTTFGWLSLRRDRAAAKHRYTVELRGNFSGQEVSVNVTAPDKDIAKNVAEGALKRAQDEFRPLAAH